MVLGNRQDWMVTVDSEAGCSSRRRNVSDQPEAVAPTVYGVGIHHGIELFREMAIGFRLNLQLLFTFYPDVYCFLSHEALMTIFHFILMCPSLIF